MEPITMATTAAVAVLTILGTKALEKTGEKIGEAVWDRRAKFMECLKLESPETVTAIEKAPEQPLNYGQAIRWSRQQQQILMLLGQYRS